jgi:general secretion pathway protein K
MASSPNKRLILISQAPVRNAHEVLGLLSANREAVPKNPIPVRPRKLFSSRAEGSALLLVLFTIILLTGLITATVGFLKNDVDEYGARSKEFRARQLAESGLAFGMHPMVDNEDRSLLEQKAEDGGSFHVSIASESTRLNINFLLQSGREDLLESLFSRWGVEAKPAKAAVEGMYKYLSSPARVQTAQVNNQAANNQAANNQAANNQAAQFAADFRAVEEMSLVPEFAPVMEKQPDWMNFFTVWGDGKLDVNLADPDMIELVTGVSSATASQFVKYRWGPDGVPFTADDRVYNSMDEVRAALGMSQEQFQLVQDLLSLKSAVDRIESTGIIADYKKTIAVVASRNTTPIHYFAWQEK